MSTRAQVTVARGDVAGADSSRPATGPGAGAEGTRSATGAAPDAAAGWRPLVTRYLQTLRELNYAPRTLEATALWLKIFMPWCVRRGLHAPVQVTATDVVTFGDHLRTTPVRNGMRSASSVAQGLNVVRQFFAWAERSEYILFSPAAAVPVGRVKRTISMDLTIEDVQRFLEAADDGTLQGQRDRAVLETFYSTGIRRSELRALQVADLDLVARRLRVMGKGSFERFAPVGDNLAVLLDDYLRVCRPLMVAADGTTALFVTGLRTPYSDSGLGVLVARVSERTGLHVTPHRLRHAFARHLLECGADIFDVQALLGHRSPQSTEIYAGVVNELLGRKLRACHGRGRRLTKRLPKRLPKQLPKGLRKNGGRT